MTLESDEKPLKREIYTILHHGHDVEQAYRLSFRKHKGKRKVRVGSSACSFSATSVSHEDQYFWGGFECINVQRCWGDS